MKKRVLSFILAVIMVLLLLPSNLVLPIEASDAPTFLWPVNVYRINALDRYSWGAFHRGIDIAAPNGTPVYAVAEGTVVELSNTCTHKNWYSEDHTCGSTYGNYIKIRHIINGVTYESRYAHLQKDSIVVKKGDSVSAGQKIALSGGSGNSENYHLHLEIFQGSRTEEKARKTFQYYVNNPSIIDGMTFSKHIPDSSVFFGDWVKENCEYVNGVYKFVYKNQYIDEECYRYDCAAKIKILQSLNPYTLPCNSETAKKFNTTSTALTDKALSAGDVVTATALYKNSEGNYWYKVTLKDGTSAYVYSKYTEFYDFVAPSVLDGSFPSKITGSTLLQGTVTANGATIDSVRARVFKGKATSGTPVIKSNEVSVGASTYTLKNSKVDLSLKFQNLANSGSGTYTLVIEAMVSTNLADGSSLSGICSANYKTAAYYHFTYGDHTHSYGAWEYSDTEQHVRYCSCGDAVYESHSLVLNNVWEPGCTYEGYIMYQCTICNTPIYETLPMIGHTYSNGKCIYCDQSHPNCVNGHNYTSWYNYDALTHARHCQNCGTIEYGDHWLDLDNGVVEIPATHTTNGLMRYYCFECEFSWSENIDKTKEHTFGSWKDYNSTQHYRECECGEIEFSDHAFSKWENCGSSHVRECKCGNTQYMYHEWDNGVIITPPSCTKTGETLYTCTVCKATEIGVSAMLDGHSFGAWQEYDMIQHKRVCECGETEYENHNWDDGTTVSGVTTITCYDCKRQMTFVDTGNEPEIDENVPGASFTGLLGDVNLDGDIDSQDLTALARHIAKIEYISDQALVNADISKDGSVSSDDLTKLARHIAKIEFIVQ